MKDYCKGCAAYDKYGICEMNKFNDNGECPCSECIIKMMCNEACHGWSVWGLLPIVEGKLVFKRFKP
jgi:hypothetical protein